MITRRLVFRIHSSSVFGECTTAKQLNVHGSRGLSSQESGRSSQPVSSKSANISRAMREYVRKAEEYASLIGNEQADYELGKRHLANIMGFDEDSLSQKQIDTAISYLLPSGLFEPRARPVMKPPEDIFPKRKPAQFGIDGRPYHHLYYTGKPNFYELMNEGAMWMLKLNEIQDTSLDDASQRSNRADMAGSDWVDLKTLRSLTLENVDDEDYKMFVSLLTRLSGHHRSANAKEFLFKFRRKLSAEKASQLRLPIQTDTEGKQFVDSFGGRKWARADIRLFVEGTGKFKINGRSLLEYFPGIYEREQVLFPLQFAGLLGQVDFVASINSGASGTMAEAGALRLALARALCTMCSDEVVDGLRLAGLLTRDNRRRERKKPGQVGSRRKFTWVKR